MTANRVSRWRDEAFSGEFLWAGGHAPALPAHHHASWQVGIVIRGALRFGVGAWTARVCAPGLVVVPPRLPHNVSGEDEGEVEYAQVELPEDLLPDRVAEGWAERGSFALTSKEAAEAFLGLLHASNEEQPAEVRLWALRAVVAEVEAVVTTAEGGAPRDELVEEVVSHLERTTGRTMPLSDLAEMLGVSRSTLLRRFQRAVGGTPHYYHVSVRLRRALQLIEAGEPIAEAAVDAGFHDQAHFTRHARLVLAMGPGKWRRRRRVQA